MEAKLIDCILEIMRGELRLFSSDITTDELKPIATRLYRFIQAGDSKIALEQFVATELTKLNAAPNPYAAVVARATALLRN